MILSYTANVGLVLAVFYIFVIFYTIFILCVYVCFVYDFKNNSNNNKTLQYTRTYGRDQNKVMYTNLESSQLGRFHHDDMVV